MTLLFDNRSIRPRFKCLRNSFFATEAIESLLESFLCPLDMFMQMSDGGWTKEAVTMLRHDLNIKRIVLTKAVISYLQNIYSSTKESSDILIVQKSP